MRFDINCIDLIDVFFGWVIICFSSVILWCVGALSKNVLIMNIGYWYFISVLIFGLLLMVLFGFALIYDGVKWCWK